jgi:hypothetical protein
VVIPTVRETVLDGFPVRYVADVLGQVGRYLERQVRIHGNRGIGVLSTKTVLQECQGLFRRRARGLELNPHLMTLKDYLIEVIHHWFLSAKEVSHMLFLVGPGPIAADDLAASSLWH